MHTPDRKAITHLAAPQPRSRDRDAGLRPTCVRTRVATARLHTRAFHTNE